MEEPAFQIGALDAQLGPGHTLIQEQGAHLLNLRHWLGWAQRESPHPAFLEAAAPAWPGVVGASHRHSLVLQRGTWSPESCNLPESLSWHVVKKLGFLRQAASESDSLWHSTFLLAPLHGFTGGRRKQYRRSFRCTNQGRLYEIPLNPQGASASLHKPLGVLTGTGHCNMHPGVQQSGSGHKKPPSNTPKYFTRNLQDRLFEKQLARQALEGVL